MSKSVHLVGYFRVYPQNSAPQTVTICYTMHTHQYTATCWAFGCYL